MNEDILALLKNRNPETRKQGIQRIGQRKDAALLPYLAQIVKTDSDESVRQLARQVGQQLKNTPKTPTNAAPKQASRAVTKSTAPQDSSAEKQAKQLLDKAVNLRIEGDKASAKELAREAFQMYPDLQNDPHSVELASSIMNAAPKVAIEQLLSNKPRQNKIRYKEPNNEPGIFYPIQRYLLKKDVSWRDILIDFIAFIVLAALPVGLILLVINLVSLANPQATHTVPAEIQTDIQLAQGMNAVGIWLRVMLIGMPFIAIFFLIQMFLTHIASIFFMSGDGKFRNLLHRTLPSMTMMAGFLFTFMELYTLLYVLGLGSWAELGWLNLLLIGGFLFLLFRFALIVGQNYRFDEATTAKGCFAIALPYITAFLIFFFVNLIASGGGSAPIGYRSLRLLRYLF